MIKNGQLFPTPFVSLTVDSSGERGLLGVAFDPNFASNQFVYVYYTATTPTIHNRVSRFTANGNVGGSETVLLNLPTLSGATNHNGGAMHFGPDGKLYVAVGDNAASANAQTLEQPARQDAAHQRATAPSRPTIRSSRHDDRQQPRDLGARAAQPVHLHVPARHAAGCSSTTSGRTPGKRSTTAPPAPTTAGRAPKAHNRCALPEPTARLSACRRGAIAGRTFTISQSRNSHFSMGAYSMPISVADGSGPDDQTGASPSRERYLSTG